MHDLLGIDQIAPHPVNRRLHAERFFDAESHPGLE
jgi:hypothetical protein